ncbi:ribosome small subunit-dependent GTPase A [Pseudenhygromyxa sp. WMMC2535]|uniref:ribosome small subunit-dependent GTPase A n=1 Tax=Pseudenhygromyxa sp. WMMC2535 TaxID=2712867 RepID=UPI0015516B2D|nr:ribosome small subunit-dependent GTPase A [Pseudenhygromyxa sp. WMMC2535]NVB42425.1 ribosome small subunit-dependent GTPase A [Pseudenhygromyxa sp. WMMC2535]
MSKDPDDKDDKDEGALARLGFTPHFSQQFELHATPGAIPGRVARVEPAACTLLSAAGPLRASVPKRLARRRPPVVGDWVIAREDGGELRVRRVLERATSLTRRAAGREGRPQVIAANLDLVMIVCGLDRDFNLGRIERWLSLVHEGGAQPVVLLSKAGLVSEAELGRRVEAVAGVALGVEVVTYDLLTGLGLGALEVALAGGRSLAFVGSSGAGKSTLVNYLCGEEIMATGEISAAHGKGRHTTSHRELIVLPERDALVIDTPGLREVGLWGAGRGVDQTFAEITEIAEGCRFSDCTHTREPGCAVLAALEREELDPRRVAAHARLCREREATARRASEHERRAHERSFAKLVRRTLADKKRDS